jgi:anti-anti-sigma regulatory factor
MNPFQPIYPPLTRTPRLESVQVDNRAPTTAWVLLRGGYYDSARQNDLKSELDGIEPASELVLDLARTEHLDCSCLGVVIAKLLALRERDSNAQLLLRNVATKFASTLHLLKLDEVFIIESIRSERQVWILRARGGPKPIALQHISGNLLRLARRQRFKSDESIVCLFYRFDKHVELGIHGRRIAALRIV